MVTTQEYMASPSLYNTLTSLHRDSYISANFNFYRGNQGSPGSKRKFPTEAGNKSSEE